MGRSISTPGGPVDYEGGMRVAVVVPALNEAESLPLVLADLPEVHRVVVVDNGSTDGTAVVARRHGAEVVYAPRRGYGTAIQAGMNHLRGAPPDILVILDADHADPADRLPDLTGPIARDEADLVLSDRSGTAEPGAMTFPQRFGNRLATTLIAGVTGTRYRDLGPFRAVGWAAIERLRMEDPVLGLERGNADESSKTPSPGPRDTDGLPPAGAR